MNFSGLLKKYRERQGFSKEELAAKIGIKSGTYFVAIESGNQRAPTIPRCRQIAEALGLSKEETDQFVMAAAQERIESEELRILQEIKEKIGKAYEWSTIRASSTCPHCKKEIDVEVDRKGEVSISAKVVEKVRKY